MTLVTTMTLKNQGVTLVFMHLTSGHRHIPEVDRIVQRQIPALMIIEQTGTTPKAVSGIGGTRMQHDASHLILWAIGCNAEDRSLCLWDNRIKRQKLFLMLV